MIRIPSHRRPTHPGEIKTPATALRLAKFFGMSADFWLNLQLRWDLYQAQLAEASTHASLVGDDLQHAFYFNAQ